MAYYIKKKLWQIDGLRPTPEKIYYRRRTVLKKLGIISGGLLGGSTLLSGCTQKPNREKSNPEQPGVISNHFNFDGMADLYPARRNEKYALDRPLTDEYHATHKNNFYEFISRQDPDIYNVYKFVSDFENRDWKIEVSGLADNTGTFYLEDLIKKMGLEERTYRFRCVERWSMAVPWTGFPLAKLIKYFAPKNEARFVAMVSYSNAEQMEGVRNLTHYPWPYSEGLTMEEATNELAFMATGLYGKPIPKQNGAPIRLVVPWKYGYKNIKSIVKITFTDQQPKTFWNQVAPTEYPFTSNVDPSVPHPRWSQAFEQMIPDGEKRPTLKYNGYEKLVAHLYT
ncbi:protein-methionine-sulfoxide reductase catalytic subunit MsrP [Fulvivirgaceae bacterium BMA12]|uniref:Protein-methionine-sulfoxide reductase catalytic subunit MsrP n=1 Tax=Agaribacillus aureus TaxID=3051825 RepID=A0ABT8L9F7_9BACT|nr:protein-methionine-sulfoxide reductase catalytic subunit MsrP [Fulvivirgaceae bacterium BMA12]